MTLEGGGSFVKGPEGYERKAVRMGNSLHGGSVGQSRMGSSTGDFEIWLKGALRVERPSLSLSLWELCAGNLEGAPLAGDPEGYAEKALETGICFHRGPVWGTCRRAHLPEKLRAG